MLEYGFNRVAALTGCSIGELTRWVQEGVIKPGIKGTSGPGDHRKFSFGNLIEVCIAKELKFRGLRPRWTRLILMCLAKKESELLDSPDTLIDQIVARRFREFRDPARRKKGTIVALVVEPTAITFEGAPVPGPLFNAELFISEKRDFVFPELERGNFIAFTILLSNIIVTLEERTGDFWGDGEKEQGAQK